MVADCGHRTVTWCVFVIDTCLGSLATVDARVALVRSRHLLHVCLWCEKLNDAKA